MLTWLPARGTPVYGLVVLVALQLAFSTAYITYFSYAFNYGERLIALHVCVVATLVAGGTLVLGLALAKAPSTLARLSAGYLPALAFAALTLLYATNVVSTGAWGHNVM